MDTRDLSGLPPLRGAVIRLMGSFKAISVERLAHEAGVASDRALAHLSILSNLGVMVRSGGTWSAGPKFAAWSESACRSRPRHSSNEASERMDAMFVQVARNVKRLRESHDWSRYELAKRSGIASKTLERLECMKRRNIPFPALMLIAQALDTTVEVLASNC